MALSYSMAVTGQKQGAFKGGPGLPQNFKGLPHNFMTIEGLVFPGVAPHSKPPAGPRGRIEKPAWIVVVRGTDSCSPQLFEACNTHEMLTAVTISIIDEQWVGDTHSMSEVTYKLQNAKIHTVTSNWPPLHPQGVLKSLLDYKMTFEDFAFSMTGSRP